VGWFEENPRVFLQNRQAAPGQAAVGPACSRFWAAPARAAGPACHPARTARGPSQAILGRSFLFPFSVFYYFYKSVDVCYFHN
jgi:hypothetical protein